MKKKITLFIGIFIIFIIQLQFIFSINKSAAIGSGTSPIYPSEQQAIREVANAYYNKGTNAQYCTYRKSYMYAPEEATSQHKIYNVCSNFTYLVYKYAFGINIQGGYASTPRLIAYANEYYDSNNIKTNDVIEYWHKTTDENNKEIYVDNKGNKKDIDLSTAEGRKNYATRILKDYNLQVGDILVYNAGIEGGNGGHALLVYEIIYDKNGNPVDAKIRESTAKFERKTTKISQGLSYLDILNENNNIYEGTFKETYLLNSYKTSSSITRNSLIYNIRKQNYFAIYRPLLKDENGDYTGKYYELTFKSQSGIPPTGFTCTGRTLKDYEITDTAKSRIKYNAIDIEKTVNVFNNSIVNLGDSLEYTIKVTNNSDKEYGSFDVVETLSDSVEILDSSDGVIEGNKIRWKISSLAPGKSIEIKYKVKVKNNVSFLGKEIISTGKVANIPSSTVKNTISSNLKENEKIVITNKTKEMLNAKKYSGLDLISRIYNESFGVSLNIENLDISDLIKVRIGSAYYPPNYPTTPTIYINKENRFYNMLLSNYFGALNTNSSGGVTLKQWENSSAEISGRSERIDTIYKENFQTGDVLIYKNKQTASNSVTYETEDGMYYLIYLAEKNKITINNNDIYGFVGIDKDGNLKTIKNDFTSLQTLLGKDFYVVLRPSKVLDLVPMELKINYNTTKTTNQDVKVTITANEEILPIEGWSLSKDKKTLTKTYRENATEQLKVYDYSGNEKTKEIQIENIDKEKPLVTVEYSTKKQTPNDIIITLIANEKIQALPGWQISDDGKKLTKTYTRNGEETVTIKDLAGNSINKTIKVENIDKEKPSVSVHYSTKEQTSNDVIVTITANEKIQEVEGWQISDDGKKLIKTYTKNGEEIVTIKDLAGNSISKTIKVANIDKEKLEYEVQYSTTLSTNDNVTVTITASKEIQGLDGWKLSEDKKVLTKTYTKNIEEEIIIKDIAGNRTSKAIIKISNIDKNIPEIKIDYSITKITNQDITVTIKSNKQIKEIEGWSLSSDKKALTKKYTSNTEENITIYDLSGNKVSDTIKINNIDKTSPKVKIAYSTTSITNKDVVVTITADKNIKNIKSWTLSSDKKHLTKTFKENGNEQIVITDEAGNSTTVKINVSNIYKNTIADTEHSENTNNDKITTKKVSHIVIIATIFVVVSIILYIKFKKNKNIK